MKLLEALWKILYYKLSTYRLNFVYQRALKKKSKKDLKRIDKGKFEMLDSQH